MILGVVLLITVLLFTYLLLRMKVGQRLRESIVGCWLLIALFVFVSTELLSLCHWFKPVAIVWLWSTLLAGLAVALVQQRKLAVAILRGDAFKLLDEFKYLFANNRLSLLGVAVILLLTFVHALIAPSFDVDSLSYHLPRATHWLVQGSIQFYETAIARQNFQAPLYSMCLAHLMALTGSDLFLNLVQWIALVVNAVVLSLIVQELKVGRRGQWLAAVLSFCVPQALSQVIVCVNDLFASTAVMAFVLYLIRFLRKERVDLRVAGQVAAAMGVALLAKYTSLVHVAGFAVPLSLIGLIKIWRHETFPTMAKYAGGVAMVAIAGSLLLLPQVVRNIRYYGDPLSGEPPHLMTNTNLTPKKLAVNYLRHISMHTATPLYALNRQVEKVVRNFAGELINDSDISYQNELCFSDYRIFTPLGKYSSNASNPVQLGVFVWLLAAIIWARFKRAAPVLEYSVIPVLLGGALYGLVFKWQPWCARLQLPYFMLMVVGIVLWLESRVHAVRTEKIISFGCLSYALLHVGLFNDWYMPAFLYGRLPVSSGYAADATLAVKIQYLQKNRWSKETIKEMQSTVPLVLERGYSIFLTDRNRLYIGNQFHDYLYSRYDDCCTAIDFLKEITEDDRFSSTVGLLISSDHGNMLPEVGSSAQPPFSWEFLLWKMADNVLGEGRLKFAHFAGGDPQQLACCYFGDQAGLILSDYSRESVLEKLRATAPVERVFSNRTFSVYAIIATSL